ncbi:MAG TPA: hypothetical protein VMT73_03820 [Anaerolineales bacterium]|nr:hypothetical protein [Anaerolineales bacterium]
MQKLFPLLLLTWMLTACDWTVNPQPFPVWTPIPSRTPGIVSPTPIILIPTMTASETPGITQVTPVTPTTELDFTPTFTATISFTDTPTFTPSPTFTQATQSVQVNILGCNTGLDIAHGMGEVTNAYVTIQNTGTVDLPNACGLLRAQDEGRPHPDKQKCVDNLPAGYQVTFKLTVDSTFKENTIIQVDVTSNDTLLSRVDKQSCKNLDIIGSAIPGDIGVVKPIVP